MSAPQDVLTVAVGLARALDADDFEAARGYLAAGCEYTIGDDRLVGPDAILASYAENSRRAHAAFQTVRYRSEPGAADGRTVTMQYVDELEFAGEWHVHRCRQLLTIGPDGLVTRIVHEEIPGEHETLVAFVERHGIVL
jgi:hypothetical protein